MNFDDTPGSGYYCSFEKKNLDEAFVLKELSITYWASSRPVIDTLRALDHSICCGVYLKDVTGEDKKDAQVGFGRVVTDYATFAWICDIIISNDHRGKGLGEIPRWCDYEAPHGREAALPSADARRAQALREVRLPTHRRDASAALMKPTLNTSRENQSLLCRRRDALIKRATAPEKRVMAILDSLGESYIFQKGFYTSYRFFIVDFYLKARKKLCLEIDGPSHDEQLAYDSERDDFLKSVRGFRLLRIPNEMALTMSAEDLKKIIS